MNSEHRIARIQELLREARIPAWLFFDFRGSDDIACRILGLDPHAHATRRWFCLVPAEGSPVKLVHRIEAGRLDHLPGEKRVYLPWHSLESHLREMLAPFSRVAMQYSPRGAIPYVARVDGGTLELVRSCGPEVVTSADLVQRLESVWSEAQTAGHRRAASLLTRIVGEAFEFTAARIQSQGRASEWEVQQFILERFRKEGLETDFPPIVAVNANSGNPHYAPTQERHDLIGRGDFLLIDLWARLSTASGAGPAEETGAAGSDEPVFADITWVGYCGEAVPERVGQVFDVVRRARDEGFRLLQARFRERLPVAGFEVDDAVRAVIREAGYGDFFIHRTGHNLGTAVHGNGVNFDNLETHDTRLFLPGLACTIEPGVYLQDFGVRSEINVYWGSEGPEITTPPQEEVCLIR